MFGGDVPFGRSLMSLRFAVFPRCAARQVAGKVVEVSTLQIWRVKESMRERKSNNLLLKGEYLYFAGQFVVILGLDHMICTAMKIEIGSYHSPGWCPCQINSHQQGIRNDSGLWHVYFVDQHKVKLSKVSFEKCTFPVQYQTVSLIQEKNTCQFLYKCFIFHTSVYTTANQKNGRYIESWKSTATNATPYSPPPGK